MVFGDYDDDFAKKCGENGILLAYMFTGPWSWMNKGAVKITDAVVDAIKDKYSLNENTPLVLSGGSMGGLGAIIYSIESNHEITACAAACPCVDILDRFNAAIDFPRTFIRAIAEYDMPAEDALKTLSPVHRIEDMKKIPYFITNCCEDEVFPEEQLDNFISMLQEKGHKLEYHKMQGKKHGEFTPEIKEKFKDFLINSIINK